jgi:uncharacterized protein (TIGR02271 family)
MFARTHVREGMVVRSQDGHKLGKVYAVGDDQFQIEKGLFFPKDYVCRYSDIADVRGDEIILRHGEQVLRSTGDVAGTAAQQQAGFSGNVATTGPGAVGAGTTGATAAGLGTHRERVERQGERVAIPVQREELDVTKRERQAGEVRVEKHVVSEQREVDVPVRRERVKVERHTVEPGRPAMNAKFEDESIVVPLRAEEVDVQKRAVVNEEVVIRKEAVEENERVSGTVRREEVDVRTDGQVDKSTGYDAPSSDPTRRRR